MNYRPYLQNGIAVSEMGFGAWQLGVDSGWKAVSAADAERMIYTALDHGINFFDSAPNYGHGTSEERLGRVFKTLDRDSIVVNTKFGRLDNGRVDFSADQIRPSIERSLQRLQIDCLDSVIIHSPPRELLDGNKTDIYEILERLQDEGKVKAYGASIDFAAEITTLLESTNARVIQSFFNILHQDCKGAFDQVQKHGAAVIAKIPFDSGWLTGKYTATSEFEGVRARWSREDIATRAALVDRVKSIVGGEAELMPAALSFCTAFDAVSTVIPGAITEAQLKSNIAAIQQSMSPAMRAELEAFYEDEVRVLALPW
jgi:aryl-alcohol dehydrogenase-like predicted oxidoreductase